MTGKIIKTIMITAILTFGLFMIPVRAEEKITEKYQKDYIWKLYLSDQGVDGSSANCIYAAEDGVLWIGSYSGLLSYDSNEFTSYQIADYAMSVNSVTQDQNGNIWVGTNGNGLYYYDGEQFKECPIESDENMAYTVNELILDHDGNLWAATKAGVYFVDLSTEKNKKAVSVAENFNEEIRDLGILQDGSQVFVSRHGDVYVRNQDGHIAVRKIPKLVKDAKVRCISDTESTDIYLGTNGSQILHLDENWNFIESIEVDGLESFNQISSLGTDSCWVCSDSGIGILEDGILTPMDFDLNNSVESVCKDYQGNYWFASSRQGIMHIYENYFTDLGKYLKYNQMVNAIETYRDKLYIGSDTGLSCYVGRELSDDDELAERCKGLRIRQVYADDEDGIWVVTYTEGLIHQDANGQITRYYSRNSNLSTDALRCIYELRDHSFAIGSEEGIFRLGTDRKIERLIDDNYLNKERILSIEEDKDGNLFVGTDGDGIYIVKDGKVNERITAKEGLFSNVILKVRYSEHMDGIWIVTGAGVSFADQKGNVRNVAGVTIANSLDLIFLNEDEVAVLAGNGFFRMKESELLDEKLDCIHYDKKLGLPIDFTANASNVVKDGILYMCGTSGAASLDLNKQELHREIRIYVKDIQGEKGSYYHKGEETKIDPENHRLNLDVRMLNYTHDLFDVKFMLEGTDKEPTRLSSTDMTTISYTNLKGGEYNYHFQILEKGTEHILAEETIPMRKVYTVWEKPYVRFLLAMIIVCSIALIVHLAMVRREKELGERYRKKYIKEHKEEIEKLAFKDLVTGVNNRNCYEQDLQRLNLQKLSAIAMISVNHAEYLKHKYGVLYFDNILKRTAQILKEYTGSAAEIYRLSEYIFCVWFEDPIELENFLVQIKETFKNILSSEEEDLSLAVGAVYHDTVIEEDYESLSRRCDEMRNLDQKHEEMKFMDRKVRYINIET